MGLVAWQRSLVAAPSPLVGQTQWEHSHLDMHLLLKCLLCSRAFNLSVAFNAVTLWGQAQGARGSWDCWLRWLFVFFTKKGLSYLDGLRRWVVSAVWRPLIKYLLQQRWYSQLPVWEISLLLLSFIPPPSTILLLSLQKCPLARQIRGLDSTDAGAWSHKYQLFTITYVQTLTVNVIDLDHFYTIKWQNLSCRAQPAQ